MDVSNCYSGVSISGLVTEAPEGERTQEQKEKLKKVIFFSARQLNCSLALSTGTSLGNYEGDAEDIVKWKMNLYSQL